MYYHLKFKLSHKPAPVANVEAPNLNEKND